MASMEQASGQKREDRRERTCDDPSLRALLSGRSPQSPRSASARLTDTAARRAQQGHRLYVAAVLLIPLILGLIWASVATALTLPTPDSRQQPIIAACTHSLALKSDGSLWAWGENSYYGALGDGTHVDQREVPTHIGSSTNWKGVAAGYRHSLGVKSNGALYSWGSDQYGRLGQGTDGDYYLVPTRIGTGNDWWKVAAGRDHSLAIKSTGSLWTWGSDSHGQLGDGPDGPSYWGFKPSPTKVGTSTSWTGIAAGNKHCLAVTSGGRLYAWGGNQSGQLGDGTTTDRDAPTRIETSTAWVAVYAYSSGDYSLALKSDGSLWAWGNNFYGQLGIGSSVNERHSPTRVGTDTDWAAVSAGGHHCLALKSDGSLWAWGDNSQGQLGDGTTTQRLVPTRIGTDTGWVAVAAGDLHSLALKSDGSLWAWGDNEFGQLGDGTTTDRLSPTQIWGSSGTTTSGSTDTTAAPVTGFLPNPNGYQFANLAYSDPTAAKSVFTHLFGASLFDSQGAQQSMSPSGQQARVNIDGVWAGGICFGMASTSISYYQRHLRTEDIAAGVTRLWDLGTYGVTQSDPSNLPADLKWNLEEYYTAQCSLVVHDTMFDSVHHVQAGTATTASDLSNLIQAIAAQVQSEPVILCIWGMMSNGQEGGHAIVAYRVDSAPGGNSGSIWIYDSNYPGVPHSVSYDLQAGTWSYPELFSPTTYIAYVPVSLVYSVVDSTTPVSYYPGWVYTNTACNIAFEDSLGRTTGKTASGYVSANPQVRLEPLLDGGVGQTTIDRYAVTGGAAREFTLQQVGSQDAYAGAYGTDGSYLVCSTGDSGDSLTVTAPYSGTDVSFATASDPEVFIAAENGDIWATASFEQDLSAAGATLVTSSTESEGRLAVVGSSEVIVERQGEDVQSVSLGDATNTYTLPSLPAAQRVSIDASSYDPTDGTLEVRIDANGDGIYESTEAVETTDAPSGPPSFWDVPASHPYYEAINGMAAAGVIGGYEDGSFRPDNPVWRQHFAKMIVGTLGFPCSEADICTFSDVTVGGPTTLYPDNYIAVAADYGITKGIGNNMFGPYRNITRAQVITMVVRAAQGYTSGLQPPNAAYRALGLWRGFNDPTHGNNVQLAEFNGLLDDLIVTGDPIAWLWQPATRGEVALILWNLANMPGLAG